MNLELQSNPAVNMRPDPEITTTSISWSLEISRKTVLTSATSLNHVLIAVLLRQTCI